MYIESIERERCLNINNNNNADSPSHATTGDAIGRKLAATCS